MLCLQVVSSCLPCPAALRLLFHAVQGLISQLSYCFFPLYFLIFFFTAQYLEKMELRTK